MSTNIIKEAREKHECQCPSQEKIGDLLDVYSKEELKGGYNHKPFKCKGTSKLAEYTRNGKKIWLCSRCILLGDKLQTLKNEH